jgi:deoxyribodipyrimidine photolyase
MRTLVWFRGKDPDGAYVRRWVPELERVPTKYIHAPFRAPATVLAAAGVRLAVRTRSRSWTTRSHGRGF